jgi:hypothetical protein
MMRFLILAIAVINPSLALAEGGPWSAPNWYVGVVQEVGPFTHVTGMHVSSNPRTGKDDVQLTCSMMDRRAPKDAVIIKRRGTAQMAQGSWCGGAGDLGTWCVDLEPGAVMQWFETTPCAAGVAEFSTGD